jgi:hypothetical protein
LEFIIFTAKTNYLMINSIVGGMLHYSGMALCSLILFSCNFSAPGNLHSSVTDSAAAAGKATAPVDSIVYKLAGGPVLKVTPGTSIGKLQLKMELDRSPAFELLGKADSSDAAMCKSWSMWYWKDSAGIQKEFDLYAVCDPDVDMKKTIQVLRIQGADFMTRRGSSKLSSLAELKAQYPEISRLGEFSNPEGASITLWDDIKAGIAFELPYPDTGKNISAVMIHQPGKKITETYLPFYQVTRKK